jgi:apolipoprotein N-acyltransferase
MARLPWFGRGILEVEVTGRTGFTPYVRWGDGPAAATALALLVAAAAAARRRPVARASESASPFQDL